MLLMMGDREFPIFLLKELKKNLWFSTKPQAL
jgi:hypothetical protein